MRRKFHERSLQAHFCGLAACIRLLYPGEDVYAQDIVAEQTSEVVDEAVTPAYYEVARKVKYSRDDVTSQMLDLINASAFTNSRYVYASLMDSLSDFRQFVSGGADDFASWYAGKEAAALTALQNLIDLYKGIE